MESVRQRPFRFAVQGHGAADGHSWRTFARKVEDLGFSTLTMPDHFSDQWGPIVALTTALDATTSLRVGSLVFDNDYRHPVHLAKEFATLDLVGEGRVEFGLGAGWMKSDYESAGIAYDRPGVRIERMAEALHIIRTLWRDGSATFSGEHYQVDGLVGTPKPHTPGGPKVLVGGGGLRVLRFAAREADIVGFNASLHEGEVGPGAIRGAVADVFCQRVDVVREAAGARFGELELQLNTFMAQITDDRDSLFEAVAPQFGLTPDQAKEVPMVLVGSVDELCEQLLSRRELYGFSYIVIHDTEVDAFAPVVARLAGN